MTFRIFGSGFFIVLVAIAGLANLAQAGLSEADRITLDQPACLQMKTFSQDITLINDEMHNVQRLGQRSRLCNVLARSITTINNTVDYMQSHVGECTITEAKIADLAESARTLESDQRRVCR